MVRYARCVRTVRSWQGLNLSGGGLGSFRVRVGEVLLGTILNPSKSSTNWWKTGRVWLGTLEEFDELVEDRPFDELVEDRPDVVRYARRVRRTGGRQALLDTDLKNTSCHYELDEYVSDNLYSQENQDDHG